MHVAGSTTATNVAVVLIFLITTSQPSRNKENYRDKTALDILSTYDQPTQRINFKYRHLPMPVSVRGSIWTLLW